MADMPQGGIPFLDPGAIPARRAAAGLDPERDVLLIEVAAIVAKDPALRHLAWYLHWRTFVETKHGGPWGAPTLLNRLGEQAGSFYLLLSLEFAPRLAAWLRRWGYPPDVTRQTLQQIASYESNHIRGRGHPGIYERQFPWLTAYLVQPYVRLGRFEYQLHAYDGNVSVWKRGDDGQVVALAEDGTRVAADGLCLPGDAPAASGWTAELEVTPDHVRGFPVDPAGYILRTRINLDRTVWSPCFSRGTPVLNLHIPAGGGMSWTAMVDSFQQALDFFPRYHPDQPFAALALNTWFMDPRLAEILPPDANPLQLQRSAYLYPVPPNPGSLWFVFLCDTANPASLPRDTSLRRQLAAFLERGGRWHGGGMFLLPDDMRRLRKGTSRERFHALLSEFGPAA